MKTAAEYADIIMNDEREEIVRETPTVYEEDRIERIYEFKDGAVVKYEWQGLGAERTSQEEVFNHRFTLESPPTPNPNDLKRGVIRVIGYPRHSYGVD